MQTLLCILPIILSITHNPPLSEELVELGGETFRQGDLERQADFLGGIPVGDDVGLGLAGVGAEDLTELEEQGLVREVGELDDELTGSRIAGSCLDGG